MSEDDLFDAVKTCGGSAERPAGDAGERPEHLFSAGGAYIEPERGGDADDETPKVVEVAVEPDAADSADSAEAIAEETTVPDEKPAAREIPVEPRPSQSLPHAASLGASLAELRRRCGMSIAQVARESKIKDHYIEALEADKLSALPQIVFVIAFVKRLCIIYGVSAEDAETLVSGLHDHLAYEIPEDINKSVICREQDEANHRRLRNLTIALAAGAVVIAALLILGGAVLVLKLRNGGTAEPELAAPPPTVDESMLMSYFERPKLKVTRIPAK